MMKADGKRRKANMLIALNKLKRRIDRGEVDKPRERLEQMKRAFGDGETIKQQNSSTKMD